MAIAFLIIICTLGVFYALWAKQFKNALGIFILTCSFILQIPEMVSNFWANFLLACSLIVFTLGIFVIIWKKKDKKIDEYTTEAKNES